MPQRRLALGMRAGEKVELRERDGALALRAAHPDRGVERQHGHGHVARMRRDAGVARAQHRVDAIAPSDGGAATAWLALVARHRRVTEVPAARALEQVAADRGHVPDLARRAGEQRFAQHGISLLDRARPREVAVADQRPDAKAAVGEVGHRAQRRVALGEVIDVHQRVRPVDVELHQVHQRGAPRDEARACVRRHRARRLRHGRRLDVLEWAHGQALPWRTCWMAATMPG